MAALTVTYDTSGKTTYQLTAEFMIGRHGAAQALAYAQDFAAADRRRRDPSKFWSCVAVCIAQTAGSKP